MLNPQDIKEFAENKANRGSLCPAHRHPALSCAECKTHGPCRVGEYFEYAKDRRHKGDVQATLNAFVEVR